MDVAGLEMELREPYKVNYWVWRITHITGRGDVEVEEGSSVLRCDLLVWAMSERRRFSPPTQAIVWMNSFYLDLGPHVERSIVAPYLAAACCLRVLLCCCVVCGLLPNLSRVFSAAVRWLELGRVGGAADRNSSVPRARRGERVRRETSSASCLSSVPRSVGSFGLIPVVFVRFFPQKNFPQSCRSQALVPGAVIVFESRVVFVRVFRLRLTRISSNHRPVVGAVHSTAHAYASNAFAFS